MREENDSSSLPMTIRMILKCSQMFPNILEYLSEWYRSIVKIPCKNIWVILKTAGRNFSDFENNREKYLAHLKDTLVWFGNVPEIF